jgi:hypothetical protein
LGEAEIFMPGMAVASAKTATKKVNARFAFMKSSIRNLIEVGNDHF